MRIKFVMMALVAVLGVMSGCGGEEAADDGKCYVPHGTFTTITTITNSTCKDLTGWTDEAFIPEGSECGTSDYHDQQYFASTQCTIYTDSILTGTQSEIYMLTSLRRECANSAYNCMAGLKMVYEPK